MSYKAQARSPEGGGGEWGRGGGSWVCTGVACIAGRTQSSQLHAVCFVSLSARAMVTAFDVVFSGHSLFYTPTRHSQACVSWVT